LGKFETEDGASNGYRLLDICGVALLYIVAARISQVFAIDPGNITPVWIPSGLMVALALIKGRFIWPGIFIGAFCGNIWAYIKFDSWTSIFAALSSASLNGFGDVLSTVYMASLISRYAGTTYPIAKARPFLIYTLFAVLLGPWISAVLGIVGLVTFGHLHLDAALSALLTWFVGDGVGALVFGPLLLSWVQPEKRQLPFYLPVFLLASLATVFCAGQYFNLLSSYDLVAYFSPVLIPLIFAATIGYGQRLVFTVLSIVSFLAVYSVWLDVGPLKVTHESQSLIELQLFIASFAFVTYIIAIFSYERDSRYELISAQKAQLETLYRQDALTGLWNRYHISEFIQRELALFQREHRTFGVLMIDLDDFKAINDRFGHVFGDEVLVELSQYLKKNVREIDLLGRWGGEEFVIVVHNSNPDSVLFFANKICSNVAAYRFNGEIQITLSVGFTMAVKGDTELTLISRADEALYKSKILGKNRVTHI
jgi:diguanylate cyclase (GGDEF)-like protein